MTEPVRRPYRHSVNYHLHALASSLFKGATQYYTVHFGIGLPEMRILSTLSSEGPLAAHQLVTMTAMDKALISRMLAALATRGYVAAVPPDADVRRRGWTLTTTGKALVKRLQPLWREREAIIQADLSMEERLQLIDMMQRMFAASEALRAQEGRDIAEARRKAPRAPARRAG